MDQEQQPQQRLSPPPQPPQPHPHPHLTTALPPRSSLFPHKTSHSTPVSSPGLFSPTTTRPVLPFPLHSVSDASTPVASDGPYLHPLQNFKTRETHKAIKDLDSMTGRKIINQYEVIEEIGRGMHGKVKLARNLENGENVAIKIIPRFSKRRRLGKVTASPQDKTKREIAILKKMRHPNVVALLEVIDDPELKKIYMVLEHVELGEIVWRKKGIPSICQFERLRIEREMRGEITTEEEEAYWAILQRRQNLKEDKRTRMRQTHGTPKDSWSVETGGVADDDSNIGSFPGSAPDYLRTEVLNTVSRIGSRSTSRAPSRTQSVNSLNRPSSSLPSDHDASSMVVEDDLETPLALQSNPGSSAALDGTMYGAYADMPEEAVFRGRSPSMADSIISHMSSLDVGIVPEDPLVDDYNYVPCFTIEEARSTFRDTVLGLEYLHYEGVVHRDIKPANLLWTKDHRVKISDFGVSYFGRPIRDGDQDEGVSESEARDFDDDLELAKTVGTPAFFAPELCYTDLDHEPPKISEQIDVWSLGVTLYCLIFARIPFIAEDEYQMFKKIATEEVYIPRRRLQPVDPQTSPSAASLFRRVNKAPYRNDGELAYEDVDDLLHDLLRRMLEKNPEKRIRLREVKRHPWVVQGIPHLIDWIDDTDPSRTTSGRKIQVDDREITRAVVPLTFLERARSAVKKAVGKVIHHRTDRETTSRRRAASSAASSTGDSPGSTTPHVRDLRRRSLRPDDYFATVTPDHPLAQSVTASPLDSPREGGSLSASHDQPSFFDNYYKSSVGGSNSSLYQLDRFAQSGFASNLQSPPLTRHTHSRSITNAFLALTPSLPGIQTTPSTPGFEDVTQDPSLTLRKARDIVPGDESSRSQSVDRGLFTSNDKRSEARVSVSTVIAPGSLESPVRYFHEQLADAGDNSDGALPSPMFFSPKAIRTYQNPDVDSHAAPQHINAVGSDGRPSTARVAHDIPEGKTPPPRIYNSSTPESFARAQQQMLRRQQREIEERAWRQQLMESRKVDPSTIPCPPSPDDEVFRDLQEPSQEQTEHPAASPVGALTTSPTGLSEVASPTSTANLTNKTDGSQIFRSDPSLPALLSGASSVSADPEGDFLGKPGVIPRPSLIDTIDTTESLTPPALKSEPEAGFPLEQALESEFSLPVRIEQQASRLGSPAVLSTGTVDEDEEGSDSDEGLVMAKSKKKLPPRDSQSKGGFKTRRRDTQTSVGSTETAKKVVVGNES